MTRDECREGLAKLAQAWSVNIPSVTVDTLYKRLSWIQPSDWQEGVEQIIMEQLRSPKDLLDTLLDACDHAATRRRARLKEREARVADGFWNKLLEPKEQDYGQFRLVLFRKACASESVLKTTADGLEAWLDDPKHEDWASREPMTNCEHNPEPHSLLTCLLDEIAAYRKQTAKPVPA